MSSLHRFELSAVVSNFNRTYVVKRLKTPFRCSSTIRRRSIQFPTPDESGNYSKSVGFSRMIFIVRRYAQ